MLLRCTQIFCKVLWVALDPRHTEQSVHKVKFSFGVLFDVLMVEEWGGGHGADWSISHPPPSNIL